MQLPGHESGDEAVPGARRVYQVRSEGPDPLLFIRRRDVAAAMHTLLWLGPHRTISQTDGDLVVRANQPGPPGNDAAAV